MNTFTYKSKYGTYKDCQFVIGYYENGNLGIEIRSNTEGAIARVTVNPDIPISIDEIAIKDYSENEGMVDWLLSMNIIEEEPIREIESGWVTIPVHKLTAHGKELLGMEE